MITYSAFSLIFAGVLLNAAAQIALKASVSDIGAITLTTKTAWPIALRLMSEPWLWLGLVCYSFSVVIWILALSRVDVSIAYPMLSMGYVMAALAAWVWLGEDLNLQKVLGMAVIISGIVILSRS